MEHQDGWNDPITRVIFSVIEPFYRGVDADVQFVIVVVTNKQDAE